MIYRIEFDPSLGSWLVKLQQYWVMWKPVCEDGEVMRFAKYDGALAWVKGVGLDKVYRDYGECPKLFEMGSVSRHVAYLPENSGWDGHDYRLKPVPKP